MSEDAYDIARRATVRASPSNTNAPTQALARHATAMLVEDLKRT